MALGARSRRIVSIVIRDVAILVGVGTGAGLAVMLLGIQAVGAATIDTPGIELYRPTADPLALLAIAAFMAIVGLGAAYAPARRTARMDPLIALRRD